MPSREMAQQRVREALLDLYRRSVPVNLRQYAYTLAGGRAPMTEKDFWASDLNAIRGAVERQIEQSGKPSGSISYFDYAPSMRNTQVENPRHGPLDIIRHSYADPAYRMESTLGTANYAVTPEAITIQDAYDFGASPEQVREELAKRGYLGALHEGFQHGGFWGIGNILGNLARPSGTGTPFELKLKR